MVSVGTPRHSGSLPFLSHMHALPVYCDVPSSPVNLEIGLLFVDVTVSMMEPYVPINPLTGSVNILMGDVNLLNETPRGN